MMSTTGRGHPGDPVAVARSTDHHAGTIAPDPETLTLPTNPRNPPNTKRSKRRRKRNIIKLRRLISLNKKMSLPRLL